MKKAAPVTFEELQANYQAMVTGARRRFRARCAPQCRGPLDWKLLEALEAAIGEVGVLPAIEAFERTIRLPG